MAQQFTKVQPGDLITASLLNAILEAVEALQTRVENLEAGSQTGGGVVITDFSGPSPLRVGDRLTVHGQNFSVPATLNQVTVGGSPVSAFAAASGDHQLVFDIPNVTGLSSQGTPVLVVVTNARGSAQGQITLRPAVVVPTGRVEVLYVNPPIMPVSEPNITANRSYVFTFDITTFVTLDATYTVTPTITGASGWTAELLQDGPEIPRPNSLITIPGSVLGTSRSMRVRVTIPTGQATGAAGTLRLAVNENTPGTGVLPGNDERQITVGSPPPTPETRVRISLQSASVGAAIVNNRVRFTRNNEGVVQFLVRLTEGGAYTVATPAMRSPAGWLFGGVDVSTFNATQPTPGATTNQPINVIFTAGATAIDTDLLIRVTRGSDISVQYSIPVSVV